MVTPRALEHASYFSGRYELSDPPRRNNNFSASDFILLRALLLHGGPDCPISTS